MKNTAQLLWVLFLFIFILACNKETVNEEINMNHQDSRYFVEKSTILDIVSTLKSSSTSMSKSDKIFDPETNILFFKKDIESISSFTGGDEDPIIYVVNYKGGGFIVFSADARLSPILAFSDKELFPVDSIMYHEGVQSWVSCLKETVEGYKNNGVEQEENVAFLWQQENIEKRFRAMDNTGLVRYAEGEGPMPSECGDAKYYAVGPLLQTKWAQGVGYNNYCPHANCSEQENGRVLAGCVAIATAQVIRYYRYPSRYNYSIMPNNICYSCPTAGIEVDEMARLIKDVGDGVSMDWGCGSSGTYSELAQFALRTKFGYSYAERVDFNRERVKQEINAGRPVIIDGGPKEYWVIIPYRGSGHTWVCDGYATLEICRGTLPNITIYISTELHMNWGWGGSYNGWYRSDYFFKPAGKDYSYNPKMTLIRP